MPIDEGVNVDLQFLVLEVKKQARASLSVIDRPTARKIEQIRSREDYVGNLKNTLENKSYFNIHRLVEEERQLNYYKALIAIASSLQRCSDFFANIADQMRYVKDRDRFDEFNLRRYYRIINRALDMIYPALTQNDLDLAQKICDFEQEIDDLYVESFRQIRTNLRKRRSVDDMLTLLFIFRYLERVGDNFLNIGEAILNIHVGEKMGIRQFRNLRTALDAQQIDIRSRFVEFKPIMNTRSGSRVAKIVDLAPEKPRTVFYKEGSKEKIDEEVEGLKLWHDSYPDLAPEILWHSSRKDHATLLLEYIEGHDLLEILIRQRGQMEAALDLLTTRLIEVWTGSKRPKPVRSDYMGELMDRKADIQSVHQQLFAQDNDLEALMVEARALERDLKAPFSTLVHGDFNVDNIIFQPDAGRLYFVDVHRSGFGDYVQDVSVFLVSNFRVPIFSKDIRQRLNDANLRMYDCASGFARSQHDATFEARLALGLFRSLITSTRFLVDKNFSADLFQHATLILRELLAKKDDPAGFRLAPEYFLYG